MQESFIRLSRSLHRTKDPAKAVAYLRSIVLNLARDPNRRGLLSLRIQHPATIWIRPVSTKRWWLETTIGDCSTRSRPARGRRHVHVMTTGVVTVVCSIGVALAAWIVAIGSGIRAPDTATPTPATSGSERLRDGVRVASATLAAGFVGGLLGFGLGGRLMMRILAATSPEARGRITDFEEVVGDVTTGGTIFLVLFLGVFAATAAAIYQLLRRWLPRRSVFAGLAAAGIGGGLLVQPSNLLDSDNRDFTIVGPVWLAVLLSVAVVILGSLTIAVLVDRWTVTWPVPAFSPKGVAGVVLLVVCVMPFAAAAAVLVVIAWFVGPPLAARRSTVRPRRRAWVLSAAGVIGLGWIAVSAAQVLA